MITYETKKYSNISNSKKTELKMKKYKNKISEKMLTYIFFTSRFLLTTYNLLFKSTFPTP